jgi:hypothetical protein
VRREVDCGKAMAAARASKKWRRHTMQTTLVVSIDE